MNVTDHRSCEQACSCIESYNIFIKRRPSVSNVLLVETRMQSGSGCKNSTKKRKRWLIDGTGILLHSKLKDLVWHVAVSFPMIAKKRRKKRCPFKTHITQSTPTRLMYGLLCPGDGDSLPDGSFMWRFAPSRFCNALCNGDLCYVTRCSWARIFDHHSFRHFILSRQIFSLM